MRTGSGAAALACALMLGCSGGADPAPEDPATTAASSPTPTAREEPSPSPSAVDSEERETEESANESTSASPRAAASPRASASSGADAPAASRALTIEQRHPNGSVLRVTNLEIEANAITLAIEVVNGATRDFGLSSGGDVVGLTDDLGGSYEFLRPEDNPGLQIEQRGTLTGELVYFGVLNPEATTLRLQTNASTIQGADVVYDPATESANEPFPHFSVEIPLSP